MSMLFYNCRESHIITRIIYSGIYKQFSFLNATYIYCPLCTPQGCPPEHEFEHDPANLTLRNDTEYHNVASETLKSKTFNPNAQKSHHASCLRKRCPKFISVVAWQLPEGER